MGIKKMDKERCCTTENGVAVMTVREYWICQFK
jgi:hypothetical protein